MVEFLASATGQHRGFLRTYKRMAAELFWEGMKSDIQEFVKKCPICQISKYETLAPARLLQPLLILSVIEGLPKSQGYDVIMAVMDRLSKYNHFIGLKHPFSAKKVAEAFVGQVVKLHGFPKSIVSNREKLFVSHF